MKKIERIIIANTCFYCGGMIVLSELCKCLVQQGYNAKLFLFYGIPKSEQDLKLFRHTRIGLLINFFKLLLIRLLVRLFPEAGFQKKYFPDYFTARHLKGCKIQVNPFFSKKNTIVLYPELFYGNPLKATHVVRWFLFHYPHANKPNAFNKNDLFICFREIFNSDQLNPSKKKVQLNYFDHELYRQYNIEPRHGSCYIIRKGKNRIDLPASFDGPIIDDMTEEDKVNTFNKCEFCYSYDTQTFYSSIAALCGCKSIVVLEPGKTKKDYIGPDDSDSYGVAYGTSLDELHRAEATRNLLIDSLDFSKKNKENTSLFIKYIKEHFCNKT